MYTNYRYSSMSDYFELSLEKDWPNGTFGTSCYVAESILETALP